MKDAESPYSLPLMELSTSTLVLRKTQIIPQLFVREFGKEFLLSITLLNQKPVMTNDYNKLTSRTLKNDLLDSCDELEGTPDLKETWEKKKSRLEDASDV